MPEQVRIHSHGETLAALHWAGEGAAFAGEHGRPCVVMAQGFGATVDSGLPAFAERFAAAGLDVLAFDYRGFGASTGEPRQLVSYRRHREDYRAAVMHARLLDGVDPEAIILWGVSYSGGHVLDVAADDPRIAAVIAMTPAVDLPATLLATMRESDPWISVRLMAAAAHDLLAGARGRAPVTVPIVGEPGELGVLTTPDAAPGMAALAGPDWRNAACARELLLASGNRPAKRVPEIRCPILFVLADSDAVAPADIAQKAAFAAPGRAEVRRYPAGHFDVYEGEWFERACADTLFFLGRHLAARKARVAASA
jgi:pimeloyl-ACP methyl ester carboxylesterase